MATDDFNRADENPLAGNWSTPSGSGSLKILSNAVQGASGGLDRSAYYNAQAFGDDHFGEIEYSGAAQDAGPTVRAQSGALTLYMYNAADTGGSISKLISGAFTSLAIRAATWASADRCRIAIAGSTIKVFKNDSQIGADFTDTSIGSGGAAGIFIYSTSGPVDNFVSTAPAVTTPLPPYRHRVQQI